MTIEPLLWMFLVSVSSRSDYLSDMACARISRIEGRTVRTMMSLEEAIKHTEYIVNHRKDAISVCWSVRECEQLAAWLRILKKAKFEYDEAWRIITHPTPDVTYADRDRAQMILDVFRDSLGRMEC